MLLILLPEHNSQALSVVTYQESLPYAATSTCNAVPYLLRTTRQAQTDRVRKKTLEI
jgi:hypothetical protein